MALPKLGSTATQARPGGPALALMPAPGTSFTIPGSVTNLGSSAFEYCGSLANVTIPITVTNLGSYAFAYCTNLSAVYCRVSTAFVRPAPPWMAGARRLPASLGCPMLPA